MNSHLKGSLQVSSLVGSLLIPGIPQIPLLGHNNQGYPCQDELVANGCFPFFDRAAKSFSGFISRIRRRKSPSGKSLQPRTAHQPHCNKASRRFRRFRNLVRIKKHQSLNSQENRVVAISVEQHIPAGNLQTNSVEQTSHSTPFQSQTPGASPALHAIPDLSLDKETPATSIVAGVFRGQQIHITGCQGVGVIEDGPCVLCLEGMDSERTWELPCQHKFHRDCLQNMMDSKALDVPNDKCPMCRESMLPPGELRDVLPWIRIDRGARRVYLHEQHFPKPDEKLRQLLYDVLDYKGFPSTFSPNFCWDEIQD